MANNEQFHRWLVEGVDVLYQRAGRQVGDKVWLVDFHRPDNNEFLVVNQFTVIEQQQNKRPAPGGDGVKKPGGRAGHSA
ncbi:Type I restriction enzyme R protein N terminus (HSDR_N) [Desulforamulus putei DSM 12395]|uniref:Type I restriction enzyme R protein N terminus (HSDR_N) n=1 Tax=Desulforamulus putei DSM 12395 TaxID=1121429 RepID=A0A1M4SGQ9_9FIRM|nr:Type I restriction enzyme R protein N terminus (HSDR_N) [Desulforamulus putei DSM 12395]